MNTRIFFLSFCILSFSLLFANTLEFPSNYKKSNVSFDDFQELMDEVKSLREQRLISYNLFLEFQKAENTIILDTRSKDRYEARHLKGAINLPYTEFTQERLDELIPDSNTRILIYCNNNFEGDNMNFASKIYTPKDKANDAFLKERKSRMLALNIPTFITLVGYGYTNIFELDELLNVNDLRIEFEGSTPRFDLSKFLSK